MQAAVDTTRHLIVAHEVTNTGSDRNQLANMSLQAREATGIEKLAVVAVRGYFSGEEILACDQTGITTYIPKPLTSGAKGRAGSVSKTSSTYLIKTSTVALPVFH
jgi:hypothetical protein